MFLTGGWADGEHRDTLVRYLLDELHAYETDYSDALAPISRGTDASLAGEHALTRPASTEELHMVHASVAADVNSLRNDMRSLTSVVVQAACSTAITLQHINLSHHFTNVFECASRTTTPPYTTQPVGRAPTTVERPLSPRPVVSPMPTMTLSTSSTSRQPRVPTTASRSQKLPTPGLIIPQVPVTHPNGTSSPKNKSWKEIVKHWLIGDWDRGLMTPLKDWPREWYQGANRQYESNEARFLTAYPEAELGHTQLLKAVNQACTAQGDHISRNK
ncbi:uncharacterized protein F5147DRAFT_819885 [Suillus discolor]|uniref:Uncharacterized protein n=1 Tax=Suillus discolor TaxID=1912936 RepID=A0A9P7EWU5_9AGAM|nr:uncharacterized protein F5147DRAFT_819885 [Suillus discolor]KAG2094650.1 hypothetical protein F5147DRAFT_819885 [Suillus discolor]